MTFQVTGSPLISFVKHSGLLLMGLQCGRGDTAPARCPRPLPTSPVDQHSGDRVSGREKLDTSGRRLECGSLPGACCGVGGSKPIMGAQSLALHSAHSHLSGADPGTEGDCPQRRGQGGPQDAGRTGREEERGEDVFSFPAAPPTVFKEAGSYLVKEHGLGLSDPGDSEPILPHCAHLQNGNHSCYLLGWL